ncbi:moxR-type regulator protein [Desulforapulum autotrophicum HRM2]|uniref:MoxR-type regulator protein n=1 Tax=Desulforapulum autotrophicum (strain ATCC 43914 / DSM 3382 / VKM B-1955 / HRM2) TaxID=177437 RepID=C0QK14_DESAH|nr:MoxR family ATPase [Desulforapulum autotrophicum]ACN16040.1 moxR-type regulator protein [Desulforapulum autotrophicum HRM2]
MEQLKKEIQEQHQLINRIRQEIAKELVGQTDLVDGLLAGILSSGHILIEGVPGLAKTSAVKALASTIQARFKRIQFTPDLLPADLIGTEIYRPKTGDFVTRKGPLFNNIILADEINRAPSKVQSALLEAMQENQVTIGDTTYVLPKPFLVLATQNPIEQEGTYPLPEAQVDRFMLKIIIDYPDRSQELDILNKSGFSVKDPVEAVMDTARIEQMAGLVRQIYVDDKLKEYIVDLVLATRQPQKYGMKIAEYVQFGASPRATIFLAQAARVRAFLQGRAYVTPQDIKIAAPDVLRHRIILSFEAEAEDVTTDEIIKTVFDFVEVP